MKKRALISKNKKLTVVIALGGNALIKKGESPSIKNQVKNAITALKNIVPLIKQGHKIVITHGNGPQVGNILIRVEESIKKAYEIPLEVCVAESEGEIGYLLEQSLQNLLTKNKIKRPVISLLTQILVDKKDSAFKNPTKPIGPFYTKAQANKLKKKGWKMVNQIGRGYRRVVPSPHPKSIDDVEIINSLLKKQNPVIITAGGGGIPVIKERGKLKGIAAVVDKDLASSCLAKKLNADLLIILTGEPYVYLNYKKKDQKIIKSLTIDQAHYYLFKEQFPPGSMGPKIESSIDFIKHSKKAKVLITSPTKLQKALKGESGTIITSKEV
jgi:carbamate kinase